MTRRAEIATVVGSVLVAAGVLVGGTRWAVMSAVEPLRVEVGELRRDIGTLRKDVRKEIDTLREDVHRDIGELRESVHGIDVRLARVEEGQRVIVTRLERVESRLDGVEAQKAARQEASRPRSGDTRAEDRRGVGPSRYGTAIGPTAVPPA